VLAHIFVEFVGGEVKLKKKIHITLRTDGRRAVNGEGDNED
jgi:hypothetical protein